MNCTPVNLYHILRVSSTATVAEMKRSYRKLAIEYHPDKNPNAGDTFKEISFAYRILTNPEQRATFDRKIAENIVEMLPKHGRGATLTNFPLRRQNYEICYSYEVTLEDLYVGKIGTIVANMKILCYKCTSARVSPSRYDHYVTPRLRHNACYNCGDEQVVVEKREVKFWIEKGMKHQQTIRSLPFSDDQTPRHPLQGNVIMVTLKQKPHKVFKRNRDNLVFEKEITLDEAESGFSFTLKHLDGSDLRIEQPPRVPSEHGYVHVEDQVLRGKGMPSGNGAENNGDLIIKFKMKLSKPSGSSSSTGNTSGGGDCIKSKKPNKEEDVEGYGKRQKMANKKSPI